jgi:hypothetical protein
MFHVKRLGPCWGPSALKAQAGKRSFAELVYAGPPRVAEAGVAELAGTTGTRIGCSRKPAATRRAGNARAREHEGRIRSGSASLWNRAGVGACASPVRLRKGLPTWARCGRLPGTASPVSPPACRTMPLAARRFRRGERWGDSEWAMPVNSVSARASTECCASCARGRRLRAARRAPVTAELGPLVPTWARAAPP